MMNPKLKDFLQERRLSLRKISMEANIPYTTLNDIANNRTHIDNVSVKYLKRLADYLHKTMEDTYILFLFEYKLPDEDAKIIIKDQKYYLKYNIKGEKGESYLLDVKPINEPFLYDAAKWEVDNIKAKIKLEEDKKKVEEWMATDTI